MNVFETIRYYFAIIGICPNRSGQMRLHNARDCMGLLLYSINTIMNFRYFLHVADSFQEYVSSAFMCSTMVLAITSLGIIIWKTPNIFVFLDSLEKAIEKRKRCISIDRYFIQLLSTDFCFNLQGEKISYQKPFTI